MSLRAQQIKEIKSELQQMPWIVLQFSYEVLGGASRFSVTLNRSLLSSQGVEMCKLNSEFISV